jgi:hypothetical protein
LHFLEARIREEGLIAMAAPSLSRDVPTTKASSFTVFAASADAAAEKPARVKSRRTVSAPRTDTVCVGALPPV